MTTIVYAHPQGESLNHAILDALTEALSGEGKPYNVIDLYSDGFNPVLTARELEMYRAGKSDDPLVDTYGRMLRDSSGIVFIFPVWWGMMPAILKGFFDKAFLKGTVYDTTDTGDLLPCLSIDKTFVVTTSEEESSDFVSFFDGYLVPAVFEPVGMNNAQWLNCDAASSRNADSRAQFIADVVKTVIGS